MRGWKVLSRHFLNIILLRWFTFISSMKDGKPPIDINVINPVTNPPQAPRAMIAEYPVPISK